MAQDGLEAPFVRQVHICAANRQVIQVRDELFRGAVRQLYIFHDRDARDYPGNRHPTAFEHRACFDGLGEAMGDPAEASRLPPAPRLINLQHLKDHIERLLPDVRRLTHRRSSVATPETRGGILDSMFKCSTSQRQIRTAPRRRLIAPPIPEASSRPTLSSVCDLGTPRTTLPDRSATGTGVEPPRRADCVSLRHLPSTDAEAARCPRLLVSRSASSRDRSRPKNRSPAIRSRRSGRATAPTPPPEGRGPAPLGPLPAQPFSPSPADPGRGPS